MLSATPNEIQIKLRCQSCGMPLADGFFGTNSDGGEKKEYCKFCWQKGEFTQPNQTMEEMIASSVKYMMEELKMTEVVASQLAHQTIPALKRWSKVTTQI